MLILMNFQIDEPVRIPLWSPFEIRSRFQKEVNTQKGTREVQIFGGWFFVAAAPSPF
jgi:hypothetical protein